ncbi:MAG: DEAD/DEAH box helicase [Elusimicrobiota bacterium]
MNDKQQKNSITFGDLGIVPELLKALENLNFKTPTPIQHKAIPACISGNDMVGIAQTGTGKTIAFLIPMIQRLSRLKGKGLILLPTRELAVQVAEVARDFSSFIGPDPAILIGGENIDRQLKQLSKKPRIIIATPGRLLDHMQQRTLNISDTEMLVLDEADRMFDMGFAPQIERVIEALPKERQTMLFSATMPDDIMKLASRHMKMPIRIEVARSGSAPQQVEQELFFVEGSSKLSLLNSLLEKYSGTVLLFVRTRHHARKIASALRGLKHNVAEIHSDRSLNQRLEAMEGFKSGKYRVLVATDIAARGIDVTGIELVINYDLPDEEENYVHRIGRTGRAGQPGHAITFASPDQMKDIARIEKLIRMRIKSSALPAMRPVRRMQEENPRFQNSHHDISRRSGKGDRRYGGCENEDSHGKFSRNKHERLDKWHGKKEVERLQHGQNNRNPRTETHSPRKIVRNESRFVNKQHNKNTISSDKPAPVKKRGIIRSFLRRIIGKKEEE